ncbi:AraC family transcriptional regulator [Jiella sp. M17.18]|uniref:AraC family transcriptional regulator n=1 Tax=Jiella sp. M17.18 TaxID=3234247 RepID=UPI0034DF1D2B
MADPLTEIVQLLQPSADFSKLVTARGVWRVHRTERGRPFYCVLLSGTARLDIDGADPRALEAGDFILIPEAQNFAMSSASLPPDAPRTTDPVRQPDGTFRLGSDDAPEPARLLVGYCVFGAPDSTLLLSLLPRVIHIRGVDRLTTLVEFIGEETARRQPGREAIVARLLEVLLIEALRATHDGSQASGLLRGLADERLSCALHRMHENTARSWTVDELAKEAGLSRTVFFERFRNTVGVAPMEHLTSWRMAIAKRLLGEHRRVEEVAEDVGYGSSAAFATAFRRRFGVSPAQFSRGLDHETGVRRRSGTSPRPSFAARSEFAEPTSLQAGETGAASR